MKRKENPHCATVSPGRIALFFSMMITGMVSHTANGGTLGMWDPSIDNSVVQIGSGGDYTCLAPNFIPEQAANSFFALRPTSIEYVNRTNGNWTQGPIVEGEYTKIISLGPEQGYIAALGNGGIYNVAWMGQWRAGLMLGGKFLSITPNYIEDAVYSRSELYAIGENGSIVLVYWDAGGNEWATLSLLQGDYVDLLQLPSDEKPLYAVRADGGIDRLILAGGRWKIQADLAGTFQKLLSPSTAFPQEESFLALDREGKTQLIKYKEGSFQVTEVKIENLQSTIIRNSPEKLPESYFVIVNQ